MQTQLLTRTCVNTALGVAAFEAVVTLLHDDALESRVLLADDAAVAYAAAIVCSCACLGCWWIRVVVVAFDAGLKTKSFKAAQERTAEDHSF